MEMIIKRKIKKVTLIVMAFALAIGMQISPLAGMFSPFEIQNVYASPSGLSVSSGRTDVGTPGSRNLIFEVIVSNNSDAAITITGMEVIISDTNSQGLTISSPQPQTGTIPAGGTLTTTLRIDVAERANIGSRRFQMAFNGSDEPATGFLDFFIMDQILELPPPDQPPADRIFRHAADFTHTLGAAGGFSQGRQNSITFFVLNRGDTVVRNGQMTISLPEGMSLHNASATAYIGTISIGQRVGRTFSIMVHDDTAGDRAHPITVTLTGTDRGGREVNLQNTFYIFVEGTGAVEGTLSDVVIENISIPTQVLVDETFEMTFNIRNTGQRAVRDIKTSVDVPDGMINMSSAIFVINNLDAGETRSFSVLLSVREDSNRSFPIRMAVEPLSGGIGDGVIQFTSVFASETITETDDVLTPQLMVYRYSHEGDSVLAGREFQLNLGFLNTSNRRLSNIRITLSSEAGTFIPVGGSNSFFVDSVPAGGQFGRTVTLRTSPSAEQRTTAITIRMTYEDGTSEFTAEDIISIPVMQVMRLSVDEIVPPFEVFAFTPGFSSLQFYNLGHTTLNNLMVTAEGDFDVMQSNSFFVGNMEGGTSDTFSFSFIPREPGPMAGMVIFTYEDIDGQQIIHEVPFEFMVMEMPVWDDPWREMPEENVTPWALIIFGAIAIPLIAGIIVWSRIRKSRLNKRLEIQDEEFNAAFDLEKTGENK